MINNRKGFTLIEVVVVIILLSIVAGFAIPLYTTSLHNGYARDAISQLRIVHAANDLYRVQAGEYLDDSGSSLNVSEMNSGLQVSIASSSTDMDFSYERLSTSTYRATAAWTGGGGDYTIAVTETSLSDVNPCCYCNTCPSIVENACATQC